MRNYEVTLIIHPDLDENALNSILEKVKGWIVEAGGTIEKVDMMGRRRMSYIIRKQREGQYIMIHAAMLPASTAELERNLRLTEAVMRFMLIVNE